MAMAQVFIPNPHDSIPSFHQISSSPPLLSPPPSSASSYNDEDHVEFVPRAPPPSPEMQQKNFGPLFEIDPSRFETPRKTELPPSPSNSLDFWTMFTPNKSPLESEPHSPMQQPSPGDPLDSAYCSAHNSTSSRQSNVGSSLSIPISPNSATSSCLGSTFLYSHSDGDTFQNEMRSRTVDLHDDYKSSMTMDMPSPSSLRPRSHTHPSHSLTPHATFHKELYHRQDTFQLFHPHLPTNFDTTNLTNHLPAANRHTSTGNTTADTMGYHDLPTNYRKKLNLKRKSNELSYEATDPMELFSCDNFSGSASSSLEADCLVIHPKSNKKACQEGKNPVIRRQSSSFSGSFSYTGGSSLSPGRDGLTNISAPSTPNHCTTPLLQQNFTSVLHCSPPSVSPAVFSPHQGHHSPYPVTPTPSTSEAAPTSLQSMEVEGDTFMSLGGGGGGCLDSLDSMDCEQTTGVDSLNNTLGVSSFQHISSNNEHQYPNFLVPTHDSTTLGLPQTTVTSCRSYSSGDGYDFNQDPQLDQGCDVYYSSYHESSENMLNSSETAESRFLLSKSL